jgi:hypothetical protein
MPGVQVGPYAGGDMHGRVEFLEWERMCTEPEWEAAMQAFPWLLSTKKTRLASHLTYAAFAATHNKAEVRATTAHCASLLNSRIGPSVGGRRWVSWVRRR